MVLKVPCDLRKGPDIQIPSWGCSKGNPTRSKFREKKQTNEFRVAQGQVCDIPHPSKQSNPRLTDPISPPLHLPAQSRFLSPPKPPSPPPHPYPSLTSPHTPSQATTPQRYRTRDSPHKPAPDSPSAHSTNSPHPHRPPPHHPRASSCSADPQRSTRASTARSSRRARRAPRRATRPCAAPSRTICTAGRAGSGRRRRPSGSGSATRFCGRSS